MTEQKRGPNWAPVPTTIEDLLTTTSSKERRKKFAELLRELEPDVGFRISSRGWAYILEQRGAITKARFDKVRSWINACRRYGDLPIDFTADESGREFHGVVPCYTHSPVQHLMSTMEQYVELSKEFCGDWLDGEEYYIQMIVEKIDLVYLFLPIVQWFNIPISSSKGWSSMLQRAGYARRFAEAEARGKKCVLLYCGDHDPDGLKMSDFFPKNLKSLSRVTWSDGVGGYDPENLVVERFGLNWDFVKRHSIPIIDNLITATGKNLASVRHANHLHPYIQQYIEKFGARKAEAVALVTHPKEARALCRQTIFSYLGNDAVARFRAKREAVVRYVDRWSKLSGFGKAIRDIRNAVERETELMGEASWYMTQE